MIAKERRLSQNQERMFEIDSYLKNAVTEIEQTLFSVLPTKNDCPAVLAEAVSHAVKTGGKRLRPALCLAAAEACGVERQCAIMPACALELLHSYTLVHDDLPCMDNDLTRRGQPTVHAKYGEAIAVLAGDALLTLAFETLARTPVKNEGVLATLLRQLSHAGGATGVIGGQVEDILYADAATPEQIHYVFEHKTAALFKAAATMGALCADAPPHSLKELAAYGLHLGFAFQIVDDILDAEQAVADTKPELSCLDIMSTDDARVWAGEHTRQAVEALNKLPGDTTALEQLAEMMLKRIY
jgi:geranylgeranyl diphosphate synthase type II